MDKRFCFPCIGACVTVLGLGMMIYGALRGEAGVVLAKAMRICLECIGIG